jgi:hypothetical protein
MQNKATKVENDLMATYEKLMHQKHLAKQIFLYARYRLFPKYLQCSVIFTIIHMKDVQLF